MIPVYRPYLPPSSLKYAHEAIDSSWLSQGPYIQKVTEKLQELLGVKYILPVNNGTSACHLMAKAHYYKNPRKSVDEIIVPNNVYVAAWNAFLFDGWEEHERHLRPLDADLSTWNIDLKLLDEYINFRKYLKTTILVVHNLGNIINVPELKRKYPDFTFLEDNCEGFLGKYEGRYSGTSSFASAISFFGNKNITCGEGGAFICQDEDVFEYIKCIHGQGQSSKRFVHSELGYNYRMTNVQAALLYGQLEVLPEILEKKHDLFETYRKYVNSRDGVMAQVSDSTTQHSNWMFGVRVPGSVYNKAEEFFKQNGVEIRPMFYPVSSHRYLDRTSLGMFRRSTSYGNEKNAKLLNKQCFILPSFPSLSKEEVAHVLATLDKYLIYTTA